jgi:hypothetical protein
LRFEPEPLPLHFTLLLLVVDSESLPDSPLHLRFSFWKQETVLDLYAGEGNLSRLYAPKCERLVCVEKDGEAFQELKRNLSGFHNAALFNCDNMDYLESLDEENVSFVDFDAYGCPNLAIIKFFEKQPVDRAVMVNATDGVLINLSRMANVDLEKYYLVNLYPKGRLPKGEWDSKRKLNRLLPWLQESFIHLLAAKHGFNTLFLYHSMNRAANVTYYGFIAYPEVKVSLWAAGKTPTIQFKKDGETWIKTLKKQMKT